MNEFERIIHELKKSEDRMAKFQLVFGFFLAATVIVYDIIKHVLFFK